MIELNKIYEGDARNVLKTFDDNSVDCCVTSPPYFGLRDYGTSLWIGGDEICNHRRDTKNNNPDWLIQTRGKVDNGTGDAIYKTICAKCGAKRIDQQIGLEETPELYAAKMVEVFTEVKRVLKKEGTLWLNLGDSYCSTAPGTQCAGSKNFDSVEGLIAKTRTRPLTPSGMKPKDLIGIPWLTAFALRNSGYYLRQDIIWSKPNPMPESVTDRCTKAHEYIFLLSKSSKYYYDAEAIKTEAIEENWESRLERENIKSGPTEKINGIRTKSTFGNRNGELNGLHSGKAYTETGKANKRSVWTVTTHPYSEAHFATFPERLIIDCIKAGCPEGGTVLDPFMGAGTTGLVARKLNRNFIGIELNPAYIKLGEKRLKKELGLFI